MKNNRTIVTAEQTVTIVRKIGEPRKLAELFKKPSDLGKASIALIDLSDPASVTFYEEVMNNPGKFEVMQEDDYSGRTTVFTVLRYLRKSGCEPKKPPPISSKSSPKKSEKSQKPKTKVAGFAAAAKKQAKAKKPGRSRPASEASSVDSAG